MRPSLIPSLALMTTLSFPAFAEDAAPKQTATPKVVCAAHSKDGSRVVQGTDLVIEAGEKVKDVVALEGNIIIRKGAEVEDAVAIRGRVIVEPGARVKGNVVSLGGEIRVQDGAEVQGDAVALGGKLVVGKEGHVEGDRVSMSFEFGGKDLVRSIIEEALEDEPGCHILDDDDDQDA
ncbi:hypothetical protein LZ198_16685 [Myxococcus sp. K15C18031901]|uniref:hypothetical protein n=1 Tax=Myxococcus dinghuensis TaxID=2906761 RepID=UPI0020A78B69|nr:hypothetical protein [Myxococcus dinghuensis]MCP3100507.1 hypothetical protein [Myxococcus dinghuensis]